MASNKQANIEYRLKVKINRTEGIQNYDVDNIYPQRVRELVRNSGTASNCVATYARFIRGAGFKNELFYKSKINTKGLTPDKLLRESSADFSLWQGAAWHIKYDLYFNISEVYHVPFEFCRLVDPENSEEAGKIAVYDDWDRQKRKRIDKDKIAFIDIYNPNKDVIRAEMEAAGGPLAYKGQVLWYSIEKEYYPLAKFDPIIEDIQTNSGIKIFRFRNTTTNFMASQMVEVPFEFETEEERLEMIAALTEYQGVENANKMLLLENKNASEKPFTITSLENKDNDKVFEMTNQTSKDAIVESFSQPPILSGIQVAGKLGNSQDLKDAYEYYNLITSDERLIFEELFKEVFMRFNRVINSTGDYSVSQLAYSNTIENTALISVLGVGGTQALTAILEGALSAQQKISTLVIVFGISDSDARAMVNGTVL